MDNIKDTKKTALEFGKEVLTWWPFFKIYILKGKDVNIFVWKDTYSVFPVSRSQLFEIEAFSMGDLFGQLEMDLEDFNKEFNKDTKWSEFYKRNKLIMIEEGHPLPQAEKKDLKQFFDKYWNVSKPFEFFFGWTAENEGFSYSFDGKEFSDAEIGLRTSEIIKQIKQAFFYKRLPYEVSYWKDVKALFKVKIDPLNNKVNIAEAKKSKIISNIIKEASWVKKASEDTLTASQKEKINIYLDNSVVSFQEVAHQMAPEVKAKVEDIYQYLLNHKSYWQYRHRMQ